MKENAGIPTEVLDQIFGFLSSFDLGQLRLVSRHWNEICERLIWRDVTVVPKSIPGAAHDNSYAPVKLSYQQIQDLGRNRYFQTEIKHTKSLYVQYDHARVNSEEQCIQTFDNLAGLFKDISKITVLYYADIFDDTFIAFQRMLDSWKPRTDFHLLLKAFHPIGDEGYIDVDGMIIKGLYFSSYFDRIQEGVASLPLSRTKDKISVRLADLHAISDDLTLLSASTNYNMPGFKLLPATLKELHLFNTIGRYSSDSKLIVPSGVERLDLGDYVTIGGGMESSILFYIDLSTATQLRELNYIGRYDVSPELASAVLRARDTLDCLTIRCADMSSKSTFDFKSLAQAGLCLKQLHLSIGTVRRDYRNFTCQLPELRLLHLYLNYPEKEEYLVDVLVPKFLQGCPKLAQIELGTARVLSKSWNTPSVSCGKKLHIVNIARAKEELQGATGV